MAGANEKTRFLREGLFAKYVVSLVGLVVFVLAVNGAMESWISYRATKTQLTDGLEDKAQAAARRIEQSISELERQISWVTRASQDTLEKRRADYAQLLHQVSVVNQLFQLNGEGREVLRVSRQSTTTGSNADLSRDMRFTDTVARGVSYAPAWFSDRTPFMSISVAHSGFNAGVTVAELDLSFLSEYLTDAQVGKAAFAYVVDPRGRVLATSSKGPDVGKDLSKLPQVAAAVAPGHEPDNSGTDFNGHSVMSAASIVPKLGWSVMFEQPTTQALMPIRDQLVRIALLIGMGLLVAILAGTLLARRMIIPITALRDGAHRLGEGDFSHRIDVHTSDELEDLAGQFNRMAGQLQETYSDLETKVEERTRDLAQSINELKVLEEVGRAVAASLDLNAVLPTIAARAIEITHADAVLIYGYDAQARRFNLVEANGIDKSADGAHVTIDEGQNILTDAAGSGEPIALADLKQASEQPLRDVAIDAGFHSVLVVPLVDQQGTLGSLVVLRRAQRRVRRQHHRPDAHLRQPGCAGDAQRAAVHRGRPQGPRARGCARNRATASGKAPGADRAATQLEPLAGGARRETTRRDRPHQAARTFPRPASGAADRLLRRPRRAARQPPPRSHRRVLRFARLHIVYGGDRAGRGDERAARISRGTRRADPPLRRNARPLCRRRRDEFCSMRRFNSPTTPSAR
ncbi:HAMP domain-containing protein [Bradyrhizobium sp. LM6.10]